MTLTGLCILLFLPGFSSAVYDICVRLMTDPKPAPHQTPPDDIIGKVVLR